jgi:hypothetical protein
MKVIRCPSCNARYNADRLPAGAVFDCNRCGAGVTVPSARSTSVALVIGGILVLAALFLWGAPLANPALVLPWDEFFGSAAPGTQVCLVLWALLGVWTLITALFKNFQSRSALTLGLGTFALLLAASTSGGGFTIAAERSLPWMAGAIALAAGLALAARGVRGAAVTSLLAGGAILLLAWYALAFTAESTSRLQQVVQDVRQGIQGGLDPQKGTFSYLAGDLGLHVAVLLAAVGGLLVAMGMRAGAFSVFLILLLAYAFLVPGATRIGEILQGPFEWGRFASDGLRALGRILVADGVALWVLLAWAAADLAAAREVSS